MEVELTGTELLENFSGAIGKKKKKTEYDLGDLRFLGFYKAPGHQPFAKITYPKGSHKIWRLVDDEPFDKIDDFAFYVKMKG